MIIKFSKHSIIQMLARGADENEVISAILDGNWDIAKYDKLQCRKTFLFKNRSPMNNQFYKYKTIEPIFVKENSEIIVITIKVYYHDK